jgi:hypothetical protein
MAGRIELADYATGVNDADTVGDPGHLVEVVAGNQQRCAGGGQLGHQVTQEDHTRGVQGAGGFIQDEQCWLVQDGGGQSKPLPVRSTIFEVAA